MIELKNVYKYYNANGVTNIGLQNINLKLNKGEFIAITGESGSGKSTLLNVISKIDNFDEGEILYKGNETSGFSVSDMDTFRKNKVGFIFQNYNILDSYTVLENVMLPLLLKGLDQKTAKEKALSLIEEVGLKTKIKSRGSKLSGGEKQRCVIARALASDCEILACDEPTGNLDQETAKDIIKLIHKVAKDKLVLIVTHNYPEVEKIVNRQIKMADGRIVEDIIYDKVEDDQEEPNLSLDYVPLERKVSLKVSTLNLKSTPKKTIFTFIVFFVICLGLAFTLQSLNGPMKRLIIEKNDYVNSFDDTYYIYNSNKSKVDLNKLEGYEYYVNPFGMETISSIEIDNNYLSSRYFIYNNHQLELIAGENIKNDDEVLFIYPKSDLEYSNLDIEEVKAKFGKKLNINNNPTDFKIVGVASIDEKNAYSTLLSFGSNYYFTGSEKLANFINNLNNDYTLSYKYHNETENVRPTIDINITNDLEIIVPESYNLDEFNSSVISHSLYVYNNPVIKKSNVTKVLLLINPFVNSKLDPYFIYVRSDKGPNTMLRNFTKMGLNCDNVALVNDNSNPLVLVYRIILLFSSFSITFDLAIALLITYFILSRINKSRIKDFEILRVLGITKKDMAKIIKNEMLILCLSAGLLAYLVFYIIAFSIPALDSFRTFGIYRLIFYFLIMSLFSLILASNFNKRIFKFTASKSMRGSDEDD